jgi:L,D-transpeptidase ErfK/SrfK
MFSTRRHSCFYLSLSTLLLFLASPCVALAAASSAPASPGGPALPLQPGIMKGTVQHYTVKQGEDLEEIAFTHGVDVAHVKNPSKAMLKKGLHAGLEILIDQRHIEPGFSNNLTGILLNLPEAEVYLLNHGKIGRSYAVGVSSGDSDWHAPVGDSKVVAKDKNPVWHIPKRIQAERARKGLSAKTEMPAGPKNPLGNRWIGFADGTYGFHGTLDQASIKTKSSHGCVHFLTADIVSLFDLVKIGTPVHVVYQPVALAANEGTVWLTAFPDFYHRHFNYRAATKALAAKTSAGAQAIDWKAVEKVLIAKDGFIHDVGRHLAPAAAASPKTSPATTKPTAKASNSPVASAKPQAKGTNPPAASAKPQAQATETPATSVRPYPRPSDPPMASVKPHP